MIFSITGRIASRLGTTSTNRPLLKPAQLRLISASCVKWMQSDELKQVIQRKVPLRVETGIQDPITLLLKSMKSTKPMVKIQKLDEEPKVNLKKWEEVWKDAILIDPNARSNQNYEFVIADTMEKVPLIRRWIPEKDPKSTPIAPEELQKKYLAIPFVIAIAYSTTHTISDVAVRRLEDNKDSGLAFFLVDNLICRYQNLKEGRIWTLVTNSFTHDNLIYTYFSAFTLTLFGKEALRMIGGTRFIALYCTACVMGNLANLSWRHFSVNYLHKDYFSKKDQSNMEKYYVSGAGNTIFGILSAVACLSPHTTIRYFFLIPMPAYVLVSGFFVYDFISALTRPEREYDSAGHIGGILGGILFWRFGLRRARFASLSK